MATARIHLTEDQTQAVRALSQSQGKTQDEILHEAIEQLLAATI